MQDAGWYISRLGDFSFAAKAGHNAEPHNHNDVGSFIIADMTGQVLADYGSGEYTNHYFMRHTRYLDLCNSSRGHSVPEIDGIAQRDGREYSSENVSASAEGFCMNMAKAYPHATLKRLERSFKIEQNKVTLYDIYEFSDSCEHSVCERFVSLIKPEISADGVKIGRFLLKCEHTPVIAQGAVKNHVTYQPETLYFVEYMGNFRRFKLEIEEKN